MRLCMPHWADLRKAIADRGLERFIARSGQEAVESVTRIVERNDTDRDFDPLMNANFAIWSAFIEANGIAGLTFEGCPLCSLGEVLPDGPANWVNGAADDQLEAARQMRLVE